MFEKKDALVGVKLLDRMKQVRIFQPIKQSSALIPRLGISYTYSYLHTN